VRAAKIWHSFKIQKIQGANAMPIKFRYPFVVMGVDQDKETLFNEVYDSEHVCPRQAPA